jgi:hypothetical protein
MNHLTSQRRRVPVTCSPDAPVIIAHVAAALLNDPSTPCFSDPRDVLRAGDIDELDISCQHCASEEILDPAHDAVYVAVGHEPDCPWWAAVLVCVIAADADRIAAFIDSLAGAGAA